MILVGSASIKTNLRHLLARARGIIYLAGGGGYPAAVAVSGPNEQTIEFLKTTDSRSIAEIGVYEGHTSEAFARFLGGHGELHLFDYEDRVSRVKARLNQAGYANVYAHGNSRKTLDSYNWSLMHLLEKHLHPIYDYAFLDGAHTWNVDALTFFLVDRLLKVGGYLDFDDYNWSLELSPSLNPKVFPLTARQFTPEQIREKQVRLIVDLLVKRDSRYQEIVTNKIYRKTA